MGLILLTTISNHEDVMFKKYIRTIVTSDLCANPIALHNSFALVKVKGNVASNALQNLHVEDATIIGIWLLW